MSLLLFLQVSDLIQIDLLVFTKHDESLEPKQHPFTTFNKQNSQIY